MNVLYNFNTSISTKCRKNLFTVYDLTEPICQKLDPSLASMTIFDTSGIFGIITNGLGIVRDITFYNKDFLKSHPDIVVEKKSDSPDEDKSLADSKALIPVLIDFFQKHPLINPKTFLGDAAFDTIKIYKSLFEDIGFQRAFIPLKTKLSVEGIDYTVNGNGIPCCPHDPSLPMRREGS